MGNDVYIAGVEVLAANRSVAKYCKNGTSTALSDGTTIARATSIAVDGHDVIVGGNLVRKDEINIATYWKNGVAFDLTKKRDSFCWGICASGGNVYSTRSIRNMRPGKICILVAK